MDIKSKILLFIVFLFTTFPGYSHVNLVYPEGGETFVNGEVVTLEWEIAIDHGPCVWNLYYSTDAGSTWETVAEGIDKSTLSYDWTIPGIETDKARIRVVQQNTDYENFDDESPNFTIKDTSGGDMATAIQPVNRKGFSFKSISPNPFRNKTQIAFQMHRRMPVKISIFSIVGEKIETLINKELNKGRHKIQWNASGLPDGIYLCRFSAGTRVITRRIVRSD